MALIPKTNILHDAIEGGPVAQEKREYIGMSGLNGPCARKIWYDFHWAYERTVTKRIRRLLERGDMEEPRVVRDLKEVGVNCKHVLNNQIELIDKTGHIRGHPDGTAENVPTAEKTEHLLEIKTMNNRLFKLYIKQGLKISHPVNWGQVHTYMGEQKLTRCLFVVTNKDTEERCYERIHYDKQTHDDCMSLGFNILTSEFIPKKIGEVTWFECKFCDAKSICHKGEAISRNCRTCKNVNIEEEGKWSCELYGHWLNKEDQILGCGDYELSEVF
jgi:hypothetical protein